MRSEQQPIVPSVFQVQYDADSDPGSVEAEASIDSEPDDSSLTKPDALGGVWEEESKNVPKIKAKKTCESKDTFGHFCQLASTDAGEDLFHLTKPSGLTTPISAHGVSILSATLTKVRGESVAAVMLTDPRDWMSLASNESLRDIAKQHLQTISTGDSLISCSFKGHLAGKDATTFGRVIFHKDQKILIVHCPLPRLVKCCVQDQISELTGRLASLPVCVHLLIRLERPQVEGEKATVPSLLISDSKVCKFGQIRSKFGLTALVDASTLPYFPQWMAYHRWLGVKLTFVYLVDVSLRVAKKTLLPYLKDGTILVSAWNVTSPRKDLSDNEANPSTQHSPWKFSEHEADIHSRIMLSIYTDCLYRYRDSSDYMLIVDPHQYLLWRNRTDCSKGLCSEAVSPPSSRALLPSQGRAALASRGLLSVKQAVFHPPVMPKDAQRCSTGQTNRTRCMPLDLSSVMRCAVGQGVATPRHAYHFGNMLLAWPGGGQNEQGQTLKAHDWEGVRLNSYHRREKLDCSPNILDNAMHMSGNWTLLDTVKEKVKKLHFHDSL